MNDRDFMTHSFVNDRDFMSHSFVNDRDFMVIRVRVNCRISGMATVLDSRMHDFLMAVNSLLVVAWIV